MKLDFAEFFAGMGLVRVGLEPFWQCCYANDIDAIKGKMYQALFPDSAEFHLCDIWETDEVILRAGSPFLVTASFPCTDLSLAGVQRGLSGAGSGAFHGLMLVMHEWLSAGKLPPMVMLENVHGFVTGRSGRDFRTVCGELRSLGYSLDAISLDARHFTPQSRPRIFIVGFLGEPPDNMFGERPTILRPPALVSAMALEGGRWSGFRFSEPPEMNVPLESILDSGDGQDWWTEEQVDRHAASMSRAHKDRLASIVPAVVPAFRRTRNGKVRLEVRFDGLAGCLRTPRGGSGRQIIVRAAIDGSLAMRWMTSTEYARLQGAPHPGIAVSERQAMFGFGDAVCVPVISWLNHNLLSPLATHLRRELARIH